MPQDPVDPARLTGEALRRWYLRTPADIERERQAASERRYNEYFGGSREAAVSDDLTELRQEQAEFGKVRRQLDKENSWLAAGALAPVVTVAALEGGALLAGRTLATSFPKAPLSFAEADAWQVKPAAEQAGRALTDAAKNALRRVGRVRFARANGMSASDMNAVVHHSEPLEYAHLRPTADPNRLANLWGVRPDAHPIANNAWAAFRAGLQGRIPSQAEIMATKLRIDRMMEPYLQRAGVSRPGPRPPQGNVR